jgi:predicted acyltransferase
MSPIGLIGYQCLVKTSARLITVLNGPAFEAQRNTGSVALVGVIYTFVGYGFCWKIPLRQKAY